MTLLGVRAAWTLFSLAAIPAEAEMANAHYRVHCARLVAPSSLGKEIAAERVNLESDAGVMNRLWTEIEERNRKIAEQKAWRNDNS